jgi:hypothetical protein
MGHSEKQYCVFPAPFFQTPCQSKAGESHKKQIKEIIILKYIQARPYRFGSPIFYQSKRK